MTDVNRPLTIKLAAALSAFTPGELSAAIQRKELKGWKQAGKIRTTLADISQWTDRCRAGNLRPGFTSIQSADNGSSATAQISSEQGLAQKIAKLRNGGWDNTSEPSISRKRARTHT
jgi:hypothetical protein